MNTLVVYASKYGCTEKCARLLADQLVGNVELHHLKKDRAKDWHSYDTIVIGGPIYVGQIRKEVTAFCEEHMELLMQKRLGLFICGIQEESVVVEELQRSYPPELMETAEVSAYFGGEYNFDKMNFLDRTLVKKIAKVTTNQSDIKEETIAAFALKLNEGANTRSCSA